MASMVVKAKCVIWFHESNFVIFVQRKLHIAFGKQLISPFISGINHRRARVWKFTEGSCLCEVKTKGYPISAIAVVENGKQTFICIPFIQ
jgi:hypothetical protein